MRILSFIVLFSILISCKPKSETVTLNLCNQSLQVIPDSVFALTKLKSLYLGNEYTLYPPLSKLGDNPPKESLNRLKSLPKKIERLRSLQVLNLCFNDLESLPSELTKLKQLDSLDLSFNFNLKIDRELKTLQQMDWLHYLNLTGTDINKITIKKLRIALPKTKIETQFNLPPLPTF